MNKRYIMILVITLFIGSLMLTSDFADEHLNNGEYSKLGDLSFKIPKSYEFGGLNEINDTIIKNGTNEIYLAQIDSNNITYNVNSYMKELKNNNNTPSCSNYTINNITVYKVIAKDTGTVHYWFEIQGDVYTIYSWDRNKNIDASVTEIINSL